MSECIYGVDPTQEVTPEQVRDAIIECFYLAQQGDSDLTGEVMMDKAECEAMIRKAFSDSGGDFDNPTKEMIVAAMQELIAFTGRFRDPKAIETHVVEMMQLVEKL